MVAIFTADSTRHHAHPNLLSLPAELLPLFAAHLPYADILSLRHSHPQFYHSPLLPTKPREPAFLSLPAEIYPLLAAHLDYPDILSLRLSHPHFYYSPLLSLDNDNGIRLRVSWLCDTWTHRMQALPPSMYVPVPRPTGPPFPIAPSPQTSIRALFTSHPWSNWAGWDSWTSRLSYLRQLKLAASASASAFPGGSATHSLVLRLKTDAEFLSNSQVQRMLRRRRRHEDCTAHVPGGCEVLPNGVCSGPRTARLASRVAGRIVAPLARSFGLRSRSAGPLVRTCRRVRWTVGAWAMSPVGGAVVRWVLFVGALVAGWGFARVTMVVGGWSGGREEGLLGGWAGVDWWAGWSSGKLPAWAVEALFVTVYLGLLQGFWSWLAGWEVWVPMLVTLRK